MMDWAGLASIFAAFFIVAASPGPATLAVSTVSAASGRKSGLIFGTGLALGLAFWGIIAATGLGAVLKGSAQLLMALKITGGLYLLWLAFGSARSAWHITQVTPVVAGQAQQKESRLFVKGLALNLSNPKAVVAWMAALSVGLGSDDGVASVFVATLGCALIGWVIYGAYATAFSLSPVMRAYTRLRRWIDGAVSLLFAAAGLALLRSAVSRS